MTTKPQITPIISKAPRDRYIADLVDLTRYKHKNSGFGWLLVCVDSFSKFAVVKMCYTKSALEISEKFREIFFQIGPPLLLHTDNGKELKNELLSIICLEFGTKQVHGRARAPWIQGQVERLNQSIKRWLSGTSDTSGDLGNYENNLQKIIFNYNITNHETTKKRPFYIFMGAKLPNESTQDNLNCLLEFQESEKSNKIDDALFNEKLIDLENLRESALIQT